jgi:hypothetical protein
MLGPSFALNPSLVLAPESALSLLPSRDLSSAPVDCSVSARAARCNGGTKIQLDFRSAFRHAPYQAFPERRLGPILTTCRLTSRVDCLPARQLCEITI